MDYLVRFDVLLNRALMVIGGVALIALMLLATGNVILRIFQLPFSGAYEILSFLGAVVTASALGYTQRAKGHIVVDILSERYPGMAKRLVNALSYFVISLFFAVVTWQIFLWGMKISESGELSETLKIIYHPFIYAVSLGFGALTVTCSLDFLQALLKEEEAKP
jgi:TRAP-type C4-dicarboxylate transport system permease small subunit